MATKTFKIGLSNTDKQNMAQDVYERLLALTFPEYDTTTEYDVGDFVVYNDQLYKCIGATSGAWDSTKWQLATLNDLLTDIEDAVAFVNDKANVDGNYPTLTAGLADNLTPYSEDSGAEQTKPFISNGTGTNNNTEIVTVGDYGLFKEKQGHTLVVNQINISPNFESTTYWKANTEYATFSVANNIGTYTRTATGDILGYININIVLNHKYLVMFKAKSSVSTTISFSNALQLQNPISANVWTNIYGIATAVATYNQIPLRVNASNNVGDTLELADFYIVELTQMFNSNIPQDLLDSPSHFSWYYNGDLSYNAGSLVNANGVKLVSTGRNLWDEEWELGDIDVNTGLPISSSIHIRTKNFNKCVPNKPIYVLSPLTSYSIKLFFYDKNENFIEATSWLNSSVVNVPTNACLFKFQLDSAYGTTYKNDVTISLYYTPEEGGEGYDQYYPYEEPYIVDTGNEVLRQAGSVKDSKAPDGTIIRRIGVVDLGSLDWVVSSYGYYTDDLDSVLPQILSSELANIICDKYTTKKFVDIYIENNPNAMTIGLSSSSDKLRVSSPTTPTGILYYELATPTTEQGTPFAKNLPINDYGMLYWLDGSNNLVSIPQGAKIFYPVNYKGFIDDLYSKVDGNSDDYALNSELNAKFETYLKSLSGYDGTATQVLKNVEGTLTWVTEE